MYYKLAYSEKKIPIPIALVALVIVVSLIYFSFSKSKTITKKTPIGIEKIEIGSITDKSATIYWRTQKKVKAHIVYGTNQKKLENTAYDLRDTDKRQVARFNHVVEINDLLPDGEYYFRFINNKYIGDVERQFNTGAMLTKSSNIHPVYGDVVDSKGNPLSDAIVVLKQEGAYPLITTTKRDGTFLLSLCCLIDTASGRLLTPEENKPVDLEIIGEKGNVLNMNTSLSNISPLSKSIVLEKDVQIEPADEQLADSRQTEGNVLSVSKKKLDEVDIIYPLQDAMIPGYRPLFKGVGIPGKIVTVTLDRVKKVYKSTVNKKRIWMFSPSSNLMPGSHTATLLSEDALGNKVKLSRVFTIAKSGEMVLGEATPEATLTPSASTPIPTIETLTPTPILTITATPTPPVAGFDISSIAFTSIAFIVAGVGVLLIL